MILCSGDIFLVGYIEYVLSPEEIKNNRKFYGAQIPKISSEEQIRSTRGDGMTNGVTNICIWGSDQMDGQKTIWFQQAKHLNQVSACYVHITYLLQSKFINHFIHSSIDHFIYRSYFVFHIS